MIKNKCTCLQDVLRLVCKFPNCCFNTTEFQSETKANHNTFVLAGGILQMTFQHCPSWLVQNCCRGSGALQLQSQGVAVLLKFLCRSLAVQGFRARDKDNHGITRTYSRHCIVDTVYGALKTYTVALSSSMWGLVACELCWTHSTVSAEYLHPQWFPPTESVLAPG